ncbi:MAG: NADH-quinone oxidoreductase subunit [Chloroflexota bacterium]|jgi:NADH-quinone oxidoreductase subunit H|nr:NADH-quinone oxidoreductase subunit [Chloroflexota bacterium]
MSVISRPWNRLTLAGKIILPLFLLLVVLTVLLIAFWQLGLIPAVIEFLADVVRSNIDIFRFILTATITLLITVPVAFVIIFMEMKVIAFLAGRIGPNRIGPWGTLSSVFHGFKVLAKEDFTPTGADAPIFTLAPIITYLSSVLTLLVIPFAPGLVGLDMNIGLLYFFAVSGLTVVGLLAAGWSSFNKYSLLGGLRAAAQIVSYELPLLLAPVGIIMLAGTLSLNQIVIKQAGWFWDWYVFQQPLAFIVFFIAATAEGNRTPFDLTEADSEIVAGFATEYSGMRFGFFFFAEYVNVFILSALTVVLFFGGWNSPIDPKPILDFFHIGSLTPAIDVSSLGIWLLWILAFGVPLLVLLIALPLWMLKSGWSFVKSLIVAFVLFNVFTVAAVMIWAFLSFEVVVGLFWFIVKTFTFVFIFVWMRGTLPRVRIDQLMGFAWKWLVEIALLNVFVTAGAILLVQELSR